MSEAAITHESSDHLASVAPSGRMHILRGVLYREWLVHGKWIKPGLLAWFAYVWVFMLTNDDYDVGVTMGCVIGALLARSDIAASCEELTFSMPPTRRQLYAIRVLLGLALLIPLQCATFYAMWYDLPQAFWKLFFESGFTEGFDRHLAGWRWPVKSVGVSVIAFGIMFPLTAMARSRSSNIVHIFVALFLIAMIHWKTIPVLEEITDQLGSDFDTKLLPWIYGVAFLLLGLFFYGCKEAGPGQAVWKNVVSAPRHLAARLIVAALLVLALFIAKRVTAPVADRVWGLFSGYPPKAHPATIHKGQAK